MPFNASHGDFLRSLLLVLALTACAAVAPEPATQRAVTLEPASSAPAVEALVDSASRAEWSLESKGFPALSKDGKIVALAFGELSTTGPPILVLTVQFRSAASGVLLRTAKFRQPYDGELASAPLETLRKRVRAWALEQNLALRQAELTPLLPIDAERSACEVEVPDDSRLATPGLEISLRGTRLVIRAGASVITDQDHPDWLAHDTNNRFGNCTYRPVLTGAYLDEARRLLVIRADYCSGGDNCKEGVAPKFALQRLP